MGDDMKFAIYSSIALIVSAQIFGWPGYFGMMGLILGHLAWDLLYKK